VRCTTHSCMHTHCLLGCHLSVGPQHVALLGQVHRRVDVGAEDGGGERVGEERTAGAAQHSPNTAFQWFHDGNGRHRSLEKEIELGSVFCSQDTGTIEIKGIEVCFWLP